ncbi:site-specific DNA-methyltransferase (adenine-specific) [Rhizobium sp. BK196]|uniref:DNA-methyltransferase n=1 Tax=Rhizobium sp. BK196 TaxID=2587073 RepID=UPI00184063F4|nr:site-specific DNA-methyltransferase [Rhizobium sp. BK196]MBB3313622.1 site-specific DNA-methyltransferase (adenine-specific) [Rhizobium sp. BK196]
MKLMHGDCLDRMHEIADRSVDMVLCDLPYETTRNEWDFEVHLPALWAHYKRICKGAIVLTAQTPFDKTLGASNLRMLRYEWIWEKGNATGHLNAKKMPMKAHENILVFYDRLPTYNPQKTFGHVRKTALREVNAKQSSNYGRVESKTPYDSTERYPRSVLFFSSDKQRSKLHPTQKPVDLMEYLIRTYTNPGDVVLDNCMGSGTTGVACLKTGREFIGIEKDLGYFATAQQRLAAESEAA